MPELLEQDGRHLIRRVRDAARAHDATWRALVPDPLHVNLDAEEDEERAYAAMAGEKARLRDHICATYGVSIRELAGLAQP